ncbi:aldehyde dehydrogenase [Staphylococcus gallinarum]|uniref:Aldehyde dehydrogenase n=1 Tax=Staphylococcus gallinarum TaxID=1293 RepID=A0ABQ0XY53_STAGA|nr:aldehyde dehydrogenase [Staphylococcus gallinarum]KIR12319.1 aldehyde dehydrogenase [Staphylococcus gallinarum]MEB7039076.1 aldehyde dehydrogenase [Staphylococcus gallinarum]RTX79331.1 aldehyde dehydrogenase [Staphylococcus gallinarum]GEQ04254.1 aldehyde dehydrogenase [Staphylococcus gallinarum]
MYQIKDYVNGEFVERTDLEIVNVLNPATEEIIAHTYNGTKNYTQQAIQCAKEAQKAWSETPAIERAQYLKKIAKGIRERGEELTEIIIKEGGKTRELASTEVYFTADYLEYMAEWARRYEGEIIQSDRKNEHILLYKKPLGVTSGILPWNFPFFLVARKMAPALVTGNTIIMKPSEETPINAYIFTEILDTVGLPSGVFNLVNGSGEIVGDELARNKDIELVSITGSEDAGKKVMEAASTNITKVNLELGGKAPAIVLEDADIDKAVQYVIDSRIINTGQVCNCVERLYVQKSIEEQFIEKLVQKMSSVTYGNTLDGDYDMGPLINKKAQENVHRHVQRAIKDGAILECGGELPNDKGSFYPATVITNCTNDMDIVQEEVFGPVLPIVTFETIDEVISLANDSKYGLTSSIYSNDNKKIFKLVDNLEFGETYINRENFEAMQGFHAGIKNSGIGGADGKHGLEEYLHTHIVYMNIGAD